MNADSNILFHEVGRLWRIRWLWFVFAAVCVLQAVHVASFARTLPSKPIPELACFAAFFMLGPVIFLVVVLIAKLETQVRTDGVYVRSFPIRPSFRAISLDGLVAVEERTFRPFRDYRGLGFRRDSKVTACGMPANRGVRLEYAAGQCVLIGSYRAEELTKAIRSVLKDKVI